MSSSSKPSMASEPETKRPALLAAAASEPTGAATPKSTRGRKPTAKAQGGGAGGAKKPPQRGLGVAQLERLRLQERWKKMTEMPPPPPPPLESVPVQFGAGGFGGAAAGRLVLGGPFGSPPSGVVVDHGSLVDPRGRSVYNHGMVVGAPNHHHHHHDHDDQEYVNHQAARELSSAPKNHNTTVVVGSDEQSFDFCSFKKKRFNGEINGNGLNLYCLNNTDQNNLNNPNYNNMNIGDHLTLGFGTSNSKVPRSSPSSHIVQNLDYPHEGVEVVAVHRKGINGGSDNQDNVVMEYRFFPGQAGVLGKNDVVSSSSSTGTGFKKNFHEKIWPYTEIGSVSVGELEASYFTNNVSASTTTTTSSYNIGADNCNPLDLSLKL